jgi:alpha-L-rhamnosidase
MTIQQTPGPASAGKGLENSATIESIRFEHHPDGFAIGLAAPRLSWTVAAPGEWQQTAYEIELQSPDGERRETTGRVASSESVLVAWPFAPLKSRETVRVRVRAWAGDGQAAGWSKPAPVEASLLEPGDWSARFVSPAWPEDTTQVNPAPICAMSLRSSRG